MRKPIIRAEFEGELVVDNFAGGGGASTGIEAAIGRPCDIAINHDAEAIRMHTVNHPETRHFCESIWDVDPREACGNRPVGLAWFSPDCTHFSKAKGGRPVKKEIRGLAWVVIRWAKAVAPRVIILENVEEFQGWGPLLPDGKPDPARKGETFREWAAQLTACGYSFEFTTLVAADYGAPTTRKRLFLVARRDRGAIAWPEKTHGEGAPNPWRTAAEIVDWSLPAPSIFTRSRPLAENTLKRIAEGMRRYVIETDNPYLVSIDGDTAVPTLIQTGYGERPGQRPRVPGLEKPLGTIVAGGAKHALVAAFLAKHYTGVVGHGLRRPIGTVTAKDHHSLVAAFLTKYYGQGGVSQGLGGPLHTIRSKACFGLVTVAGEDYQITDVGMRMLQPHELYAAQGFPTDYIIDHDQDGNPLTKTAQMRMCGNSVSPPQARALVESTLRG